MEFLLALSIAFQVWMFVDAIRRRAEPLWYLLLLLPIGALAYFLFVKLDTAGFLRMALFRRSGESLAVRMEQLAEQAEASPSFENRIRLARALFEAGSYAEAEGYFEKALGTHPDDKEAQYGLGLSRLERGDFHGAVETLTDLVDLKFGYRDYGAARALVRALWRGDRREEALALLEEIAERSRHLRHRVALARHLIEAGLKEEAARVLDDALARFERASDFIRKREGRWATEARGLRRHLTS